MSDRTSAGIFGRIFNLLAKNPTEENKTIAKEIFDEKGEYDFSNYQMDADDALIVLGLARTEIDPNFPEDGEIIIYGDE